MTWQELNIWEPKKGVQDKSPVVVNGRGCPLARELASWIAPAFLFRHLHREPTHPTTSLKPIPIAALAVEKSESFQRIGSFERYN